MHCYQPPKTLAVPWNTLSYQRALELQWDLFDSPPFSADVPLAYCIPTILHPLCQRQSKADHEAREIEVNELRAKLMKSKKERHRLSEALSKGWRNGSSDSSPMESTRDFARITGSCNDWRKVVSEPRHDNIRGNKRPAPAGLDFYSKDAAQVPGEGPLHAVNFIRWLPVLVKLNKIRRGVTLRFTPPLHVVEICSREATSQSRGG